MKTNTKKFMSIAIIAILLIGTNIVVSASYNMENTEVENTALDMLFKGVSSDSIQKIKNNPYPISLENLDKAKNVWEKSTYAVKGNTPLDLLFQGV